MMKTDFLKQFLNVYWIRPETAIFNALLAKNLPNDYLNLGVSADINCGDGVFSFIANGGQLDASFNLYQSAKIRSNRVKSEDIYAHYDDSYNPKLITEQTNYYRYGIDISEYMLQKARALPIYQQLVQYCGSQHLDAGDAYALKDFESQQAITLNGQLDVISIFSSIYMYSDVNLLLTKMHMLLNAQGTFLVNVKTPAFRTFYEQMEQHYPPAFAEYIERNMRKIINTLHPRQEWESLFENGGFSVEKVVPTMHQNLAPVWTIGLRFLTPLLVKMSDKLNHEDFLEIKQEFTTTFEQVLRPFYQEDIDQACSYLYVLKKKAC